MIPVIWLVVSVVFLLIHLVPGDPIQQMLGEGAASADLEAARRAYGLDVPLGEQYVNYWRGVLHGDLGNSIRLNQNVGRVIAQAYPSTIKLTIAALIVALLLSVPAGVRSAVRRNRWDDRLLSFVSLLGLSFPNFALGPILILFFAIYLGWLPVSGSGTIAHMVLPAATLGGALAAILTRMVRTSMLEELSQDYIRTARATCWRNRHRDDLLVARNRAAHNPGNLQPRLLPCPGMHSRNRPHLCRRELLY
jgi:ABC-type dipeptide/oligopeptide/nickel transport system permease component